MPSSSWVFHRFMPPPGDAATQHLVGSFHQLLPDALSDFTNPCFAYLSKYKKTIMEVGTGSMVKEINILLQKGLNAEQNNLFTYVLLMLTCSHMTQVKKGVPTF